MCFASSSVRVGENCGIVIGMSVESLCVLGDVRCIVLVLVRVQMYLLYRVSMSMIWLCLLVYVVLCYVYICADWWDLWHSMYFRLLSIHVCVCAEELGSCNVCN